MPSSEVAQRSASRRLLPRGRCRVDRHNGFPCQSYPPFCWTSSACSLPPSWQTEQQRRTSEKRNILLVFWEMANNFSGKVWWGEKKMQEFFFPTKSSPAMSRSLPRHTHSQSLVVRTQFCFLQPLLYYKQYPIFSFFCSSLNQSFKTLEDLSFFSERHVTQPISIGQSFCVRFPLFDTLVFPLYSTWKFYSSLCHVHTTHIGLPLKVPYNQYLIIWFWLWSWSWCIFRLWSWCIFSICVADRYREYSQTLLSNVTIKQKSDVDTVPFSGSTYSDHNIIFI